MTKSLLSKIRDVHRKKRVYSLTSYALRFRTGDKLHVNDICHARMKWYWGEIPKDDELLQICVDLKSHLPIYFGNDNAKQEMYVKYLEYIIKESPWKDCFVSKSAKGALRYGLYLNVDKPLNQLMGAVIAAREGYEYSDTLPAFTRLSKRRNKHAAFLTSLYFRSFNTPGGMNTGHNCLHRTMQFDEVIKFFKEGYFLPLSQQGGAVRTSKATDYSVFKSIATMSDVDRAIQKDTIEKVLAKECGVKVIGAGWARREVYPEKSPEKAMKFLTKVLST